MQRISRSIPFYEIPTFVFTIRCTCNLKSYVPVFTRSIWKIWFSYFHTVLLKYLSRFNLTENFVQDKNYIFKLKLHKSSRHFTWKKTRTWDLFTYNKRITFLSHEGSPKLFTNTYQLCPLSQVMLHQTRKSNIENRKTQ